MAGSSRFRPASQINRINLLYSNYQLLKTNYPLQSIRASQMNQIFKFHFRIRNRIPILSRKMKAANIMKTRWMIELLDKMIQNKNKLKKILILTHPFLQLKMEIK